MRTREAAQLRQGDLVFIKTRNPELAREWAIRDKQGQIGTIKHEMRGTEIPAVVVDFGTLAGSYFVPATLLEPVFPV